MTVLLEECDVYCPGAQGCHEMYEAQAKCVAALGSLDYEPPCGNYYCGKCYIHFYKHTIRGALIRLKCCFGLLPNRRG